MWNHWTIVPAFVLAFLAVNLWLGLRARKGVRTTADHVIAGRGFGFLLVFFVSIGEIYSSVSFLGQPGWAYEHGVAIVANVGIFIALVAFWLGPRIWAAGKEGGYLTQAHFFGARFHSEGLRAVAAVIGVAALIAYISVQMIGGGYVFEVTTDGRIPYWLGALLAFSVVAVYVYAGGLRAIGWVAVFKGILMALVGVFIVYRVVSHYYGSVPNLFAELARQSPAHLTLPGPKGFVNYAFHTSSLINGVLAFYMWPHMFANFYSAASPRIIRRQAIFIPLYNILTLSFTLVGFAGILVVRDIKPDTVMVEMLKRVAAPWLVGLFCAGGLAASMVTAAACALSAAATLGNDLLQPRLHWPDARLKRVIQLLVLAVIGGAYGVALLRPALMVYIILMAYAVTAQFLPATLIGLSSRRVGAPAIMTGLLAGFVTALVFVFRIIEPPYNIHAGILGLAVNIPAVVLFHCLGRSETTQAALRPPR